MLPGPIFMVIALLPVTLMSAALTYLGVRGLVTRKPIIFSARLFVWLIIVAVASMAINFVSLQFSPYSRGIDFLPLVQVLLFVLVVVMLWRTMQGYVVMGVGEEALKQALTASLDELGLAHRESLGGFALDTLGDVLQVSVQGWVGSAQLRLKTPANREHLRRIVTILKRRLAEDPRPAGLFIPVTYTIAGLLLIAIGVYLALLL